MARDFSARIALAAAAQPFHLLARFSVDHWHEEREAPMATHAIVRTSRDCRFHFAPLVIACFPQLDQSSFFKSQSTWYSSSRGSSPIDGVVL
jgi:hypothetical protein